MTVAVTGAASGLGAATALELSQRGAVPYLLDIDSGRGGEAAVTKIDVADDESVAAAFAGERAPEMRAVIHCAGISGRAAGQSGRTFDARLGEPASFSHVQRVIGVNLIGTLNVVRHAALAMAKNPVIDDERGVLVLTGSIAGYDGQDGQSIYAASKAGVAGMTLPLARELAGVGIRVVTIAPGIFETPILGRLDPVFRDKAAGQVSFPKRLGRPAEFAKLACDIIENQYINGEVIRIDGGLRT